MSEKRFYVPPLLEYAATADIPGLSRLEAIVDLAIQEELNRDNTGTLQQIFDFFNSPGKPLSLREFLQFWASLSEWEKDEYMLIFI